MDKNPTTLLIADDHPLFLKGLHEVISDEFDWMVIKQATNGQDALNLIINDPPDIAILDINMPYKSGLEIAKYIGEHEAPTAVIILTMYDDELIFNQAASYGVKGYILKESAIDDIVDGVEKIMIGESFISPKFSARFFTSDKYTNELEKICRFKLTQTEQKVIRLIAENNTTNMIADKLFISNKTVEHHRSNICKKLDLMGKNALLRYVLENKNIILKIFNDW